MELIDKKLVDKGITQATKATVARYTGILIVYFEGMLTVTVSENHTWNEIYDYVKYWEAENPKAVWANSRSSFLFTENKLNYFASHFALVIDGAEVTAGVGQSVPVVPTLLNGAFFEDVSGAVWENEGCLYYASTILGREL